MYFSSRRDSVTHTSEADVFLASISSSVIFDNIDVTLTWIICRPFLSNSVKISFEACNGIVCEVSSFPAECIQLSSKWVAKYDYYFTCLFSGLSCLLVCHNLHIHIFYFPLLYQLHSMQFAVDFSLFVFLISRPEPIVGTIVTSMHNHLSFSFSLHLLHLKACCLVAKNATLY